MNAFVNAIGDQEARTENGMKARESTSSGVVDLFYNIGASRGKDIVPAFIAALVADEDRAIRIAQWARDVRGGAGERQVFRDILAYLEVNRPDVALKLIPKIPEIGRFDDLFAFKTKEVREAALTFYGDCLRAGNKLSFKWLPREKSANKNVAFELMKMYGLTPRQYRKLCSGNTEVVEQLMCSKKWSDINFSHVPSLAHARYKKAFTRNAPVEYKSYVDALVKGDDPTVKVNAGAVYPYDVIKGINRWHGNSYEESQVMIKQWEALENFVGDASILPMVDVSGSMCCPAGGNPSVTCLDVSMSLGLYLADKNTGAFKDVFLTFSGAPKLMRLQGNVIEKYQQMSQADLGMNTDLHLAFEKVLGAAIQHKVPQEDMPKIILVMSDMQFDSCVRHDDSAIQMIRRKYEAVGYEIPKVVFWNLNSSGNVPVGSKDNGVALVSGFSPSIVKAVLKADMSNFTPAAIMDAAIMIDRYTW